ncbi:MAG: hypothetical protein IT364_25155 [Candidatus Hydrogenedentes bacterium]|nr:hypothetical protein [Candidatus Hydrogenedentota bacterium]
MKQFRDASLNNLKLLGLVLKMWANESAGEVFPPLDKRPGHLTMQGDRVYPEYLTDTGPFISPAHPEAQQLAARAEREPLAVVDDHSYWYLGYAIPDERTGLAFVAAYKSLIEAGKPLDVDLQDTQAGKVYRLRKGVERFLISDINNPAAAAQVQSQIPLMIERPGLQKGGACVLFLDGHTEFIEYPGRFPMTERFIRALQSLDELKRPGSNASG